MSSKHAMKILTLLTALIIISTSSVSAPSIPIVLAPAKIPPRTIVYTQQEEEVIAIDYQDLYWLSRIISAEAKSESMEGQIAVGNVVLNRVAISWYPDTIYDVIFQKGQFCPVDNGSIYHEPTQTAIESAKKVLSGYRVIDDMRVVFFYNPNITSAAHWIRTRTITHHIGNHVFAR